MVDVIQVTPFSDVYDSFFSRITDDMYMEYTELDTFRELQPMLVNAIPRFEFPRFPIFDYELGTIDESKYQGVESGGKLVPATFWVGGFFHSRLTDEEISILSMYMLIEWLSRQLATTENTQMKYSGSDFKLTSQANHMAKLKVMLDKYEAEGLHLQRLYKRRKIDKDGKIVSTFAQIMEV